MLLHEMSMAVDWKKMTELQLGHSEGMCIEPTTANRLTDEHT
jgi:hypothetical protein